MVYIKPCNAIHSILGNYAKISGEHLPYSLFKVNKTTAFAYCLPVDRPLVSVKLCAKNGTKDLFLVRFHYCNFTISVKLIVETQFVFSLISGYRQCKLLTRTFTYP